MPEWIAVPSFLWLPCLSIQERHVLAEVHSFEQNGLKCFAGNAHFSERLLLSESRTRKVIYKLIRDGWLVESRDVHEGIRKRTMWLNMDKVAESSQGVQKQPVCPDVAKGVAESSQMGVRIQPQGVSTSSHIRNQYKETDKETNKEAPKKKTGVKFQKPELEECMAAFAEAGSSRDEGEKFWNYYEANGWHAGRQKMRDWHAAARNWIKRSHEYQANKPQQQGFNAANIDGEQLAAYIKNGNAGT
jgi:hypothetical protein